MALWKLALITLGILSVPYAILKLIIWVCKKDQKLEESKLPE
jgi:hypothetical protein